MTFKFGITHDPAFRFHNDMWGYRHSFDQFDKMIVLLAAENPVATAYLEAALISQFSCPMAERQHCTKTNTVTMLLLILALVFLSGHTCTLYTFNDLMKDVWGAPWSLWNPIIASILCPRAKVSKAARTSGAGATHRQKILRRKGPFSLTLSFVPFANHRYRFMALQRLSGE